MTLLLLLACTRGEDTSEPVRPPWEPFIAVSGEGVLRAGAGAVTITPECFESFVDLDEDGEFDKEEELLDCGCDRLCPEDEGYSGPDEGEGDGDHQAVGKGFTNRIHRPGNASHGETLEDPPNRFEV